MLRAKELARTKAQAQCRIVKPRTALNQGASPAIERMTREWGRRLGELAFNSRNALIEPGEKSRTPLTNRALHTIERNAHGVELPGGQSELSHERGLGYGDRGATARVQRPNGPTEDPTVLVQRRSDRLLTQTGFVGPHAVSVLPDYANRVAQCSPWRGPLS